MANTASAKLLVTGAGGQLGRRIVAYLPEFTATGVIAASRSPGELALPKGFEARRIDFDDPASLAPAFAGIERALIIATDKAKEPGLRIRQHFAAIEAARQAGVRHLLYTSILNPDNPLIPFASDHLETEKAIERTGLDFTILRLSCYTDDLPDTVAGAHESGRWYTSAGDGRINYVPRNDVARTAAAALTTRSGVRERLDITGPRPHTTSEIASIAAKLGASPIEVVQLTDERRAEHAHASGLPMSGIPIVVATDAGIRAGAFDVASAAVEDLTGQPATSVEAYLAANKVMWQP